MSGFSSKYDVYEQLGEGSYGTVMRCVKKRTGQQYAVKIMKRGITEETFAAVMYEAELFRKLRHPNIVRLLQVFAEANSLYVVFDLVVGGELMHEITERQTYAEVDASHCMQQILEAINFCHSNGVVHCDLKPENILLVSRQKGAAIKIADFGLAAEVQGDEHSLHGISVTLCYRAPEIIQEKHYGKPVDMWSCGVILFLLVFGDLPFDHNDNDVIESLIVAGTYKFPSRKISQDARDAIKQMLTLNAYKRITAEQALKHPWIRQREYVAPKLHLNETVANLKKFNARRKFKGAILAAVAAQKFFKSKPANNLKKDHVVQGNAGGKHMTIPKETIVKDQASVKLEIIKLTEKLVNAYEAGDSRTVERLCHPHVTTFDPESSHIIEGIDFDNFFPATGYDGSYSLIQSPYVHLLGNDTACIAYIRSSEYIDRGGRVQVEEAEETRVWHKRDGKWKNIHFHSGLSFDGK